MKFSVRVLAVVFGAALALPALAADPIVVKLDPATQRRLGVATAPLQAERRAGEATAFARALDAVPLATLDADIAAAVASVSASQAEAARTRALSAADATVSRRVAEAAAAQARADAAKLQLLRRRLGLEWSPGLAALSDAQRGRLVSDIAAGRAALVRIDAPSGAASSRAAPRIELGGTSVAVTLLGPTRSGDPRLQSTGVLGVVRGPAALQLGVGTVVPATLAAGAAVDGVILPRAALLRTGGRTFAYVRRDPASYERRPVLGGQSAPAGLFAPSGFRPGENVVIAGAAQLFAAETPSVAAQ